MNLIKEPVLCWQRETLPGSLRATQHSCPTFPSPEPELAGISWGLQQFPAGALQAGAGCGKGAGLAATEGSVLL